MSAYTDIKFINKNWFLSRVSAIVGVVHTPVVYIHYMYMLQCNKTVIIYLRQ